MLKPPSANRVQNPAMLPPTYPALCAGQNIQRPTAAIQSFEVLHGQSWFLFSRPNCDLNRSKTLINIAHSLLRLSGVGALSLGLLLSGCGNDKEAVSSKAKEGYKELDDLYIVDCLLPNQVRRLGNTSYLPPRKAIKTTTSDCRIRGGEYGITTAPIIAQHSMFGCRKHKRAMPKRKITWGNFLKRLGANARFYLRRQLV